MPRIPTTLFQQARRINKLLPLVLKGTHGDIEAAQNELRWMAQEFKTPEQLRQACLKRSKNYPLQYILGSQPFERLDVLCQPGVLIPRWETEEWTLKLARALRDGKADQGLKVLDLCTGTGCIPLLLSAFLKKSDLWAVDISDTALSLVEKNLKHNELELRLKESGNSFTICKSDVLAENLAESLPKTVDLITANPPYIPTYYNFDSLVERSVRLYEPKLALIGDKEFYTAIFRHACNLNAKGLILEVGDQDQINHTHGLAIQFNKSNPDSDNNWSCGAMHDSNGKPRIAILWKPSWSFLESITN